MSGTKDTNPKDAAATNRLDLTLFPDTAVAYGALAMVEGDQKYGAYNWRVAGVRASTYVAALRRHMMKWWNGQEVDPTTGVPHLASAIACLGVLIDAAECQCLNDDRPPRWDMDVLLASAEAEVKVLRELFPNKPARNRADGEAVTRHAQMACEPVGVADCVPDGVCGHECLCTDARAQREPRRRV